MNYTDLNIHLNKDVKSFEVYPNTIINVLQYLPIEDKNEIIQMTLQNSEENGIFNILKIDMYFRLYITYLYSDIEFTNNEQDDPVKLYDELNSMGIIDAVIAAMNPDEYSYLRNVLDKTINQKLEYRNTIASVLNNFMENLPVNANAAKDIIEKFNPEDFQQVLNFARAANGGRDIN